MINDIVVNIEELDLIKNKIKSNGDDLINILSKIESETELTKDYYDSLTGDDFREFMIDYLDSRIEYINNHYLSFIGKLDEAKKSYQDYISEVARMVGDKK